MKALSFLTTLLIASLAHADGVSTFGYTTYTPSAPNTFGVMIVSSVELADEKIVVNGPKDKIKIFDTECDPEGWKLIYSHDSLPAGKTDLEIMIVMREGFNEMYYLKDPNIAWMDEPFFIIHGGNSGNNILTGNRKDFIFLGNGDDVCMSLGGIDLIAIGGGSDNIMSGTGVDLIFEGIDGANDLDKLNQGGQPDNISNAEIEELTNPGP